MAGGGAGQKSAPAHQLQQKEVSGGCEAWAGPSEFLRASRLRWAQLGSHLRRARPQAQQACKPQIATRTFVGRTSGLPGPRADD